MRSAKQEEERRKIEAEKARLQAEKEAKERAEREAHEAEMRRIREEEARVLAAARLEALKPDKEKILTFASVLSAITYPDVSTDEAKEVVSYARTTIGSLSQFLSDFAR